MRIIHKNTSPTYQRHKHEKQFLKNTSILLLTHTRVHTKLPATLPWLPDEFLERQNRRFATIIQIAVFLNAKQAERVARGLQRPYHQLLVPKDEDFSARLQIQGVFSHRAWHYPLRLSEGRELQATDGNTFRRTKEDIGEFTETHPVHAGGILPSDTSC